MKRNQKLAIHTPDTSTSPAGLFKEMRARRTWSIMSGSHEDLQRTLAGRLFIVNKTPPDMSGKRIYSRPRAVTYPEALRFIVQNTSWGRRSWTVLHHHGIKAPGRAAPSSLRYQSSCAA